MTHQKEAMDGLIALIADLIDAPTQTEKGAMIKTQHCPNCETQAVEIMTLKRERDKLVEFVNSLLENHGLEYQGMVANDK